MQLPIIIGGNHHNTLGVIRSLGQKGLKSFVVILSNGSTSFVLKSKYVQQGFIVESCDKIIDLLLNKFKTKNYKHILIACNDTVSSLIDQNRNLLEPYFIVPGCKQEGLVTFFMDKNRMCQRAVEFGLNVPQTHVLSKYSIYNGLDIPYPCIIKPLESRGTSKSDICLCYNQQELSNKLSAKDVLVQQYIDKQFEFQFIGCSLNGGENIIIPGLSIILRQPSTTNTGFLHYRALDSTFSTTLERTKMFIQSIGYSGLFSVEFLRDKDGKDFFMEINFRNDGNSIAVTNAGVNLPYLWYLNAIGHDFQDEPTKVREEYVMPEFAELSLLSQGVISLWDFIKDMYKATSFMDYASYDIKPTNGWGNYLKQLPYSLIKYCISKFKRV